MESSALSEDELVESESNGQNKFMHYVYMAKDARKKLYVGITKDLKKREDTHNAEQGALFTKGGNFQIIFHEQYGTLAKARQREIQIKKWRRDKKEKLIERYKLGLPTKPEA